MCQPWFQARTCIGVFIADTWWSQDIHEGSLPIFFPIQMVDERSTSSIEWPPSSIIMRSSWFHYFWTGVWTCLVSGSGEGLGHPWYHSANCDFCTNIYISVSFWMASWDATFHIQVDNLVWLIVTWSTLNSAYNEVAFNENLAITKENLCTKYTYSPLNTSALTKSHL